MVENGKLQKILPTSFELVSFILLDTLVVLLGNSHELLTYFGLESSNNVLRDGAGVAINNGLTKLDSLRLTDQVVTFLIWALVGMFCFSVVRGFANVYHEVEFDRELSSNRYIHPSTFRKASFWRQVILDFVVLLVSLSLVALLLYGFMAFILPVTLAYTRAFMLGTSLASIADLAIGLAVMYVWLMVFDIVVRIVFHHRQLTARA